MSADLDCVLDFLSDLYQKGLSYNSINLARSALSTQIFVNNQPVGTHPLVVRLMKGIFNKRPSLPKTNVTWDPAVLLEFLKTWSPAKSLTLRRLTLKTAILMWLLTGQRGQSISLVHIKNITITDHVVKIRYGDTLKTTRVGFQQSENTVRAYAPDRRLCLVTYLREYLSRTKEIRNKTVHLFLTTQKPHGAASKQTLAKWIRTVMLLAGLDISIFTPHSIRAASTSAALKARVPLETILATAGWTRSSTFRQYYDKPAHDNVFSTKILELSKK